jgi:guanine deaminase
LTNRRNCFTIYIMAKEEENKFMRLAGDKARQGVKAGQTPFGACIVKEGKVISCAHNSVWKKGDITAHAEICAIREACRRLKTVDLSGCTVYSTCEPCPMCFSACHWARISRIVYGARISDALKYGFNELAISSGKMKRYGRSGVEITGNLLRRENLELFRLWLRQEGRKAY